MALWSTFLELCQVGLFGLTSFYGGQLGAAIVSLSLIARLALLPLSVRLALRGRAHARRLRALRPRLEAVRKRHAEDPSRLGEATMAVYREAGVSPVDTGVMKGALVQAPFFLGLFHAVRGAVAGRLGEQGFLWIAQLARPDVGIAIVAATLTALAAALGSSEPKTGWISAVPALSVGLMALFTSAGFGLYLAGSGAVGLLQGLIVRRLDGGEPLNLGT